jgi:AAA15 family ATPase/GTPase
MSAPFFLALGANYRINSEEYDKVFPVLSITGSDLNRLFYYDLLPKEIVKMSSKYSLSYLGKNGERLENMIYSELTENPVIRNFKINKLLEYASLLPFDFIEIKNYTRKFTDIIDLSYTIKNGDSFNEYRLDALSEGTIIWLALSAILLDTNAGELMLDEPDRHLDKDMVRSLVSLFREHAENGPGWLLLTTHNETLLNQCRVEEVQLVSLNEEGFTQVKPIENQDELREQIYQSGKQIGWYYTHNAL